MVTLGGRIRLFFQQVRTAVKVPKSAYQGPLPEEMKSEAVRAYIYRDLAPVVLYLRPFSSDPLPFFHDDTIEEVFILKRYIKRCKTAIAIAKPGSRLPPPGFKRVYHGDAHWQDWVEFYMSISDVVIINISSSPGLMWEVEKALQIVDPARLVLFISRSTPRSNIEEVLRTIRSAVPEGPDGPEYMTLSPGHHLHISKDPDVIVSRLQRG